MLLNGNEQVNAILLNDEFITHIDKGSEKYYTGYLGKLKLSFLDKRKLGNIDKVCAGND